METRTNRPDADRSNLHATSGSPSWWKDEHTSTWERVKAAFRRDWEQTKRDFSDKSGQELNQDVGDTVAQAVGKDRVPPPGVPNPPDADDFDTAEPALRYGYGASSNYRNHANWDTDLEGKLEKEWSGLNTDRTWDKDRAAIRRGWDEARKVPFPRD